MLMITRSDASDPKQTLKLEGKLLAAWIGELEKSCQDILASPSQLCLDLRDLSFVDAAGARFLAALIRDGARVTVCSGFVAEVLRLKERC